MKIYDMPQGTPEWYQARLGIPTSSRFDEIITPKTGKLSASARKYAFWLIAEQLLNRPLDNLDNLEWIARGKELEPQAVRGYEFEHDVQTRPVGFITTDDGLAGCSPDRLVIGKPGGVEIKIPAPQTMIAYLIDGPDEKYKCQVQGQLMIAELEYVDFYAWSPEMPAVRIRTARDEPFIALLRDALTQFNDMRLEMLERVRSQGMFAERAKITNALQDRAAQEAQKLPDDPAAPVTFGIVDAHGVFREVDTADNWRDKIFKGVLTFKSHEQIEAFMERNQTTLDQIGQTYPILVDEVRLRLAERIDEIRRGERP